MRCIFLVLKYRLFAVSIICSFIHFLFPFLDYEIISVKQCENEATRTQTDPSGFLYFVQSFSCKLAEFWVQFQGESRLNWPFAKPRPPQLLLLCLQAERIAYEDVCIFWLVVLYCSDINNNKHTYTHTHTHTHIYIYIYISVVKVIHY